MKKWLYDFEFKEAKKYAYFLLSRKSYPSDMLRQKLSNNNIELTIIDSIIKELIHLGYLKDENWLRFFIEKELNKGWGPRVIMWKLKQKNIRFQTEFINHIATIDSQKSAIQKYLKKRKKPHTFFDLVKRGFDLSAIEHWQEF